MSNVPDRSCETAVLAELPDVPRADARPVFAEPWEAQVFAMALLLHERGAFTWPQWAECLSRSIHQAQGEGDSDLGDTYYLHWLDALETIVVEQGIATRELLTSVGDAWSDAARHTPHGQPIMPDLPHVVP